MLIAGWVVLVLGAGSALPAAPAAPGMSADQMGALVIIESSHGRGSGFLTRIREVDFVVSNLHVFGGEESLKMTTLRGDVLPVHAVYGAVGRDVALLKTTTTRPVLESADDVLELARIDDAVLVAGNTLGGGVATHLRGALNGIGADRIEVDARFELGNSGSPVIHLASGKVIGIASYIQSGALPEGSPLRDLLGGASGGDGRARWFAFRYDGVKTWQQIDVRRWKEQQRKLDTFRDDTIALLQLMNGQMDKAKDNPRVNAAFERLELRLQQASTREEAGYRIASLIHDIKGLAESGVRELEHGDFYDYFRSSGYWESSIPLQLELRSKIRESLAKDSEKFGVLRSRLSAGG